MGHRLLITGIILSLFSILNFAQGSYLESGQNGAGFSAGFSTNKDVSGFGGSAAISIGGSIDFGVEVGKYSFKDKMAGNDLSAVAISPMIQLHILKQTQTLPISLSAFVGYDKINYSANILDDLGLTFSGNFYSLGGEVAAYIPITPTVFLRPDVGIAYSTGESEIKHKSGQRITEKSDDTSFLFGLSCFGYTNEYTILRLRAGLSINDTNTGFGVSAGAIFKF